LQASTLRFDNVSSEKIAGGEELESVSFEAEEIIVKHQSFSEERNDSLEKKSVSDNRGVASKLSQKIATSKAQPAYVSTQKEALKNLLY
jgi:hypothetical protein